jgi:hypothetical protein
MLVSRDLECRGESLIVGDQGLGIRVWGSGVREKGIGTWDSGAGVKEGV